MAKTAIARAATTIDAPAPKVWDALTKPELIKQYMFGTDVVISILSRLRWLARAL